MCFTEIVEVNQQIIKHVIAHKIYDPDCVFKTKSELRLIMFKEWKGFVHIARPRLHSMQRGKNERLIFRKFYVS